MVTRYHDTPCEAAVTDEPGTGNYVPPGVLDVPCSGIIILTYTYVHTVVIHLSRKVDMGPGFYSSLLVFKECKPIMDMSCLV